jgi:hypothetical protein
MATPAQARNTAIQLFSSSKTYTPGQPITVYLYYFRLPEMMMWSPRIPRSPDFRVVSRVGRPVSARIEGDEFEGSRHLLYRFVIMPKRQANTLSFGPIRLAYRIGSPDPFSPGRRVSLQSNTLTFTKRSASGTGSTIQKQVTLPSTPVFAQSPFYATYRIQCPQAICGYKNVPLSTIQQLLQKRVTFGATTGMTIAKDSMRPTIAHDAKQNSTTLTFRLKVYPLQEGELTLPTLNVSLPIAHTVKQMPILSRIRGWLVTKGIPRRVVNRFVSLRQSVHTVLVGKRDVMLPGPNVNVGPSKGLQGSWLLNSRIIRVNSTNYWRVSLTGRGFLQAAVGTFRKLLNDAVATHKLKDKLALAHLTWLLPDQRIDGRITLNAYFRFKGKRVALPALQATFIDDKGKAKTQQTPAVPLTQTPVTEDIPFVGQGKQRRIYLHHHKQPTTSASAPVTVWSYKLPDGFPLAAMLKQRWSLDSALQTERRRVGQLNIERRQYRRFGGGSFSFTFSSGPTAVAAQVGQIQATLRNDMMARIPAVQWGTNWIFHHTKSSKADQQQLRLLATTNRKRYFPGEKVEYTLGIRFPASLLSSELRTVFKDKIFKQAKLLTLPKFTQFPGMQVVDDLKLYNVGKGEMEFRYKVRFKAPQGNQLKIDAASLRLPRGVLIQIARHYNTCLFSGNGVQSLMFRQLALDHYNRGVRQRGCEYGTQILQSPVIVRPIEALPEQAKQLQLVGTFRLSARLTQLSYPNKNSTEVDKPFYLVIDVAGDGDLDAARNLLRDQLSQMGRSLRKSNVTSFIENVNDDKTPGSKRLQVQLVADEVGSFTIPSLKLKYYHREEGVLTAQTLPIKVKIEPRTGRLAVAPRKKPALSTSRGKRIVQNSTDLRPNIVLGARALLSEESSLSVMNMWLILLGAPVFFLLFLGWHRVSLAQAADPNRNVRNRAFKQLTQQLQQVSFDDTKKGARASIDAVQRYLIERLSLQKKTLTVPDIEETLAPYTSESSTKEASESLVATLQQLEASLYGGASIDDPKGTLQKIEQQLRVLDRALPKSK